LNSSYRFKLLEMKLLEIKKGCRDMFTSGLPKEAKRPLGLVAVPTIEIFEEAGT